MPPPPKGDVTCRAPTADTKCVGIPERPERLIEEVAQLRAMSTRSRTLKDILVVLRAEVSPPFAPIWIVVRILTNPTVSAQRLRARVSKACRDERRVDAAGRNMPTGTRTNGP